MRLTGNFKSVGHQHSFSVLNRMLCGARGVVFKRQSVDAAPSRSGHCVRLIWINQAYASPYL